MDSGGETQTTEDTTDESAIVQIYAKSGHAGHTTVYGKTLKAV